MNLRITGYDKEVNRSDPEGLHITYDMDSDRPIISMMFWMDDGATPLECMYPVKQGTDGRYFRGINVKPTINGEYHFHLMVLDDQNNSAEAVSDTKVNVISDEGSEGTGDAMTDLSGLFDLIKQTRIDLFPDLYNPTHPDARDGFLSLDQVRDGVYNTRVGHDRGAEWAKEIMRRAKEMFPDYNIGLAEAKPGSENHGGATNKFEDGFTQDIYVLGDNGAHWDFQIDGGNAGYPDCRLVDEFNEEGKSNWEPIKSRFVAIEDI